MSPDPGQPSHLAARAALLIVLVGTCAWGALYIERTSFEYDGTRVYTLWDDSMISMHYARNLARGEGLVWNAAGERVQGITNPGLTLVMAAIHGLPVESRSTSRVVQLLHLGLLLGILALAYALGRRIYADTPLSEWVALAAVVAIAIAAPHNVWTLQGAEVGWVAFWLLALALLLERARLAADRPAWGFVCLLALGPLLRWDVAMFSGLALLAWASLPGARVQKLVQGGVSLALVSCALLLASWLYYGDPLPNTYYLKATGSPRSLMLESGLSQLGAWLPRLLLPLALAAVAVHTARKERTLPFLGACAIAALAYGVWVGGDWLAEYGSRFFSPLLPVLLLLAVGGAWQLLERVTIAATARVALLVLFAAGLGFFVSPDAARSDWLDRSAVPMLKNSNQVNYVIARYVAEHTPEDASVGVTWAGIPVYFSERPAVDVLGKSDRHIAKLAVDRFLPGHSKWDWDYVINQRSPDLLLSDSRGVLDREDFRRLYRQVWAPPGFRFFLHEERLDLLDDDAADVLAISESAEVRALVTALFRGAGERGWAALGDHYLSAGRSEDAIAAYRWGLRRRPNWPTLANQLAWLLAVNPRAGSERANEAVALAEQAAEASERGNANALDTLATAYAAAGRFGDAVQTAEEALALASDSPEVARGIAERLRLFRNGRAYREP